MKSAWLPTFAAPDSLSARIPWPIAANGSSYGHSPRQRTARIPSGKRLRIGGCVIVRQRPGTAKGFVFLSLEDETGVANAIVTPDLFHQNRLLLTSERFLAWKASCKIRTTSSPSKPNACCRCSSQKRKPSRTTFTELFYHRGTEPRRKQEQHDRSAISNQQSTISNQQFLMTPWQKLRSLPRIAHPPNRVRAIVTHQQRPSVRTVIPTGRPHTCPSGSTNPVRKSSYSPVA